MKKKIFIFLWFTLMIIFFYSPRYVNASGGFNQISIRMAGNVDENYMPVINPYVGEVQVTETMSSYGNSNDLHAFNNDDYEFSFYLENDYILSTKSHYNFRTSGNHDFLAFFRPINKAQVLVVDANNKYLGSLLVDFNSELTATTLDVFKSKLINRPGYEFDKWNVNFPLTVTKELTVIKASYKMVSAEEFNVKVLGLDNETILDTNIAYGKTITINAPTTEGVFSHWQIGEEVLSYSSTHTLSVYHDLVIKAVFNEEETIKANTYLHPNVILDNTKMIFFVQNYIPEGYVVIEQGLMYVNTPNTLSNDIMIDDEGVQRVRALRVSPNNEYAVLKDTLECHNLYLRSYLVVQDSLGNFETIYSNQILKELKYNINYVLNGGTNHPSNSSSCSIYRSFDLEKPTRAGYIFKGWYLNSEFNGEAITSIGSLTKDITLYAKWEVNNETFTITYNYDGGNPKYTSKQAMVTAFMQDFNTFFGTSIAVEELQAKTWGVEVKSLFEDAVLGAKWGWIIDYLIKVSTDQEYANVEIFKDMNNVDFHSVIRANLDSFLNNREFASWPYSPNYAIEPAANGFWYLLGSPLEYNYNTEITLISPVKSGYNFAGWYDNPNFDGSKITKIPKGSVGNKVLYAKWVKVGEDETFAITYYLDGGNLATPKVKFSAKELPYVISTPTKEGYRFLGWYLESNYLTKITKIETIGNKKLYAKWEKIIEYSIVYNLNGGILSNPKTKFIQEDLPYTIPIPTRSGYRFLGWYTDVDLTNKVTQITNIGNKTLYAKWEEIIEYTIVYNLDGGTLSNPKTKFILEDLPYTLPIPTKSEYSFLGWYTESTLTNKVTQITTIGNKTLYAKWEKVTSFTITYNLNGGTLSSPKTTYNLNELPLTLQIPTRTNFTFGGWYQQSDFSGSAITKIESNLGNVVLYAKWIGQTYSITYVLNGASWYSSKNDMKNDFLTDFYNYLGKPGGNLTTFMHGAGNTSGYGGTWYDHRDSLYAINDKSSDATKDKFINQPLYNKKWLVFFNYMDTLVKETNPEQSFWGSPYTGCLRLQEYMKETRYQDKTSIPAVVKGPGLYVGGQGTATLPNPYLSGTTFLGWYENADFSGSKITSISTSVTGNKTLYAKWDIVAPPVGSVYLRLNYSGNGTLTAGQSVGVSVTAIVDGGRPVDPMTWSSSNTSVATVDQNGRVTAVGSGTVIITCKTVASGAVSTVGFTVYGSEISDPLLKYLITQNTGVLWTRNITYYGFTGNYANRISNTVNKYLPESLSITSMMLSSSAPNNPNRAMSSIQYIVVHDTGSAGAASNAKANGGWCVNPSNTGSSWHYTTGNDGIFKHMNDNMVAWHAGDGSVTFSNRNTGVAATTAKPKVTTSGGYLYFNGTKSSIANTTAINAEGLLVSVGSNGNYYLGPTWVNDSVLVNKGGNSNGIGIETAVNDGSNVYFTWQRTSKLIADLMTKYGLGLGQVGFHRNFSNKLCPQTMIRAGLQNEFWKLVEVEYMVRKNYSGYTVTFTSHNTSIINNHGRIVSYPTNRTNVQYTIKVTKGTTTQSITLNALVPGTKDF